MEVTSSDQSSLKGHCTAWDTYPLTSPPLGDRGSDNPNPRHHLPQTPSLSSQSRRLLPAKPCIAGDGAGGDLLVGPQVWRNGGRLLREGDGPCIWQHGGPPLSHPPPGLASVWVAAGEVPRVATMWGTTEARAVALDGRAGGIGPGGGRRLPMMLTAVLGRADGEGTVDGGCCAGSPR
jgi:hypothetical protein